MSNQWRDSLAGARMQVDQQFNDRVLNSQFTNQQWGLIMTAVEFDIENPEQPEQAQLVANTEQVKHVLPELDNLTQGMGGPPANQQGGSRDAGKDGGGFLGSIRSILSGGSSGGGSADEERLEAAGALTQEYAEELQQFLEEQGRWEGVCERAASE